MRRGGHRVISLSLGLLAAGPAMGQAPPPALPGMIERVAPQEPPRVAPRLSPPPPEARRGPGETRTVPISRVVLLGNEALPDAQLHPLVAGLEGETVTLARIEEARLAVLMAYRSAGYPFVAVNAGLAPLPEGGAELRLAVTEGYVAEVRLDGDIGPAGTQVLRFLQRVKEVRPVTNAAVERALLLASDVPGVAVRGVLQPLQGEPGALRLVAQVTRRPFSGYASVDNRAYKLTGPWQGLVVGSLNSFSEFGERTELSLFYASAGTQVFGQAAVEGFVGASGLRVRLYAGQGYTEPGSVLAAIGYRGGTAVAGASATYPVIRSRPANLWAIGQFDAFESVVETGTGDSRSRASRDAVRALRGGLDAQMLDDGIAFLPPAVNSGSFRLSQGLSSLGASRNDSNSVARLGGEFDFTKISGEFQRTQPLFAPWDGALVSIQGLAAGQWTSDVLPPVEKFYLGGNRLGRGFYAGQVTGDRAYAYGIELQLDVAYDVPFEPALGTNRATSQFYVFRDFGRTLENLEADPDRKLSSWGGGVRTVFSDTVQLDIEVARRLTTRPDATNVDPLRATAVFFRSLVRF